jgi:hypothetical protein
MKKKLDVLFVVAPSPNPTTNGIFKIQGMPSLGLGYIATYLENNS